nr:putative ribonuclease H-like domain-containing protein [Tanacetum cinerariifolium]
MAPPSNMSYEELIAWVKEEAENLHSQTYESVRKIHLDNFSTIDEALVDEHMRVQDFGDSETIIKHKEFMDSLMRKLKGANDEMKDPFKIVETKVEKYPIHYEKTHWRMQKQHVLSCKILSRQVAAVRGGIPSELSEKFQQSRELQKSLKNEVIANCGFRPEKIKDKPIGKQTKFNKYPSVAKDEMRIEQYFLMTDYLLWEVILNGDSPTPTRVIEGVVQPVAPPTAEQRLARKNKLKARGTLLMALPDKHQLKFNIHKDAKTLMEAIEKRFGGNKETKKRTHTLIWRNKTDLEEQSLDDLFNSLKIYEAEVKSSSSASTCIQNIDFMSSQTTDNTNEPVSAVASVSAASAKILVSALPNMDTLSNAIIYSFFASQSNNPRLENDDLKQIDADDLEEINLKWQMAMLTVECYNCHRKGHFAKECRSPKDTRRNVAAEPQRRNVPVETSTSNALVLQCDGLESVEARLLVYQQNETVFEEDIKLLKLKVQLRDNALVILRQKFEKAEQERDDLKLKLENSVTDESLPASPIYDRYHSGDMYHAVSPPYTGTFMPPKPNLVFHAAPNVNETDHTAFNVKLSPTKSSVKTVETSILAANHKTTILMPKSQGNNRNRKACFVCKSLTHLIKDYDYYDKKVAQTPARNHAQRENHQQYARLTLLNPQKHVVPTAVLTKSKLVPITTARPVTAAVPKTYVTRPRPAKSVVTKPHSPPRRHINCSQSPKPRKFSLKVTAAKASMVNAVKGNGVWKPKCPILDHVSRNTSASMTLKRFDYNDALGRSKYLAFGGNPKGGKIFGKGKIRTGKLDFDDVYFVKELKFNLFSISQMCNKKHSVNFTDTECIVLSPEFKLPDKNQVLLRVPRENNMYNVDLKNIVPYGDLTYPLGKFDGKADEGFLVGYSVSSSGPTWLFYIDTLTKTMNYQPVTTSNQSNPSAGVQEQFDAEKAGEETIQQYVLFPLWSSGSKNPQNTDDDAAFRGKKPEFEGEKSESEVHVSPSSSSQTKKHDDKTKKEAKGKSPVELSTGYRNLSADTNTFSAAGLSNTIVSPTHGKSLYVDTSQYPDDPNMPELEDISYSDDEEDVGTEADFTNLETTIIVSHIPTTRVHKDHPVLVDLPDDKRAIGHTREEGIDYEEVFALVARIEAIRLFLAYASFMGFMVYQMDVKNAFLYETIEEEVYVCQPLGFEDPDYPDKVYKVFKALYGLHQAPRACQDKYIAEILRKFGLTDGKSASTLIDTEKPLLKDPDDQTVYGKESSNQLMADNLPKIIWYSTHHVALNEELASPKANGSWANDNWHVVACLLKKKFLLLVMNYHCQKKRPLLEEAPTARVILPL